MHELINGKSIQEIEDMPKVTLENFVYRSNFIQEELKKMLVNRKAPVPKTGRKKNNYINNVYQAPPLKSIFKI